MDLSGDGLTLIITPDLDREPRQGENVTYRCEVKANEIYMNPVWRDEMGSVISSTPGNICRLLDLHDQSDICNVLTSEVATGSRRASVPPNPPGS